MVTQETCCGDVVCSRTEGKFHAGVIRKGTEKNIAYIILPHTSLWGGHILIVSCSGHQASSTRMV